MNKRHKLTALTRLLWHTWYLLINDKGPSESFSFSLTVSFFRRWHCIQCVKLSRIIPNPVHVMWHPNCLCVFMDIPAVSYSSSVCHSPQRISKTINEITSCDPQYITIFPARLTLLPLHPRPTPSPRSSQSQGSHGSEGSWFHPRHLQSVCESPWVRHWIPNCSWWLPHQYINVLGTLQVFSANRCECEDEWGYRALNKCNPFPNSFYEDTREKWLKFFSHFSFAGSKIARWGEVLL